MTEIHRSPGARAAVHGILVLGAVVMVFPFFWMFLTSLKSLGESTQVPVVLIPKTPEWKNYAEVLALLPFLQFLANTVIVTAAKVGGQLVVCSMAAYAFARVEFPFKNVLFALSLTVLMVPGQVYMLPQFLIMGQFGWLNSLQALIAPGVFSAFGMFLLRQSFQALPRDMAEAAQIDGCHHFTVYSRVMLPLVGPGLMALAIFTMIASWNDLMWPLIVNSSPSKMTLAVGLASLQGQFSTNFPVLMAGSLMATLPMVVFFIFFQKQFVEGIATTGSK